MNDQRKTKKQLLEELNLIANKAARPLEGENLVIRASTDSIAGYLADTSAVMPEEGTTNAGHVMATKKTTVNGGMP